MPSVTQVAIQPARNDFEKPSVDKNLVVTCVERFREIGQHHESNLTFAQYNLRTIYKIICTV